MFVQRAIIVFLIILVIILVGLGVFVLVYKDGLVNNLLHSGKSGVFNKLVDNGEYTYLINNNEPRVQFGVEQGEKMYAISLSLSDNNPGKLEVNKDHVIRKNILPAVDWGYYILSDEFRHEITINNESAQRVFAFNLAKSSDELEIRDDNGVAVTVVNPVSGEELFDLGYPVAQDAKQGKLYYRYRILDNKLIIEPIDLSKWQNVSYPVVLNFSVEKREHDEVLIKIGQNGDSAGNSKDGDIVMIKPEGWLWGKYEKKNFVIVRINKLTQEERDRYISKEGEENDLAGASRYGIDYTNLATPEELEIIRDLSKENPILDATQLLVEKVIQEKIDKGVSLISPERCLSQRLEEGLPWWKVLKNKFVLIGQAVAFVSPPATVNTYTVGVGGSRDFSSLSAWEAAREGDLLAYNTVEVAECYNDGDLTDRVTIDGWTTATSNYIKIYTPTTERHTGTKSNGFKVVNSYTSGGGSTFDIREDYVRIEGLVMQSSGSYHTIQVVGVDGSDSDIKISNNIIYHSDIYLSGRKAMVLYGGRVKVWNNVLYCSPGGVSLIGILNSGATSYIYNNSFYGFATGVAQTNGNVKVKNTSVLGDGSGNFSGTFDATSDYNCSSDATAPGSWSVANCHEKLAEDNYFLITEGLEDLHIKDTNADIYNVGVDLSADADCPVSDDFEGDARGIDIGADEYVTSYPDPLIDLSGSALIDTISWSWSDPNVPSADYYAIYSREGDVGNFVFEENSNDFDYIYPNPGSPLTSYWLRVYSCDNIFGCNPVYTEANETTLSGSGENPVVDFDVCILNDGSAYFTDNSYDPDGGDIESWDWDFGDGGDSEDEDAAHQYSGGGGSSDWWDSSWLYRKKIVFDTNSLGVTSNQTDVPVYIKQDPGDTNFWLHIQSSGEDVRFVDMDGTELDYELERFDNGSDYMDAWVEVPQVDGSTTTDYVWMYYGNALATDNQDSVGTWSNNYVLVQHLDETSGIHYDATSYANNAMIYGSVNQNASGKIDGGDELFSSSDYLIVPSDSGDELSNFSAFTIEVWLNFDTLTQPALIINKPYEQWKTSPFERWGLGVGALSGSQERLRLAVTTNVNTYVCSSNIGSISTGSFYYIAGRWSGSYLQNFVDGVANGGELACYTSGSITQNNEDIYIGLYPQWWPQFQGIDGTIDEIRVSNVSRTDDWIKFQNASMRQTLVSYESEEEDSSGGSYEVILEVIDDEGQSASTSETLNLDTEDHCEYIFLASASVDCDSVGLSWENAPGASSFEIYRSDNGGPYNLLTAQGTGDVCSDLGCAYDDDSVGMDTTYAYYIKASTDFSSYYNSTSAPACTGDETNICPLSEITPLCSPSSLSVISTPCGAIILSWPEATGADGYQLERSLINEDELFSQIGGGMLTETAYSDQQIIPGVTYYYRIRSVFIGPEYSEYIGPVSSVSYCYRDVGYSED